MKSRKIAVILSAVLVFGVVSPSVAYGSKGEVKTDSAWECRNPENCTECKGETCPACTGQDCSVCGGVVKNGVCGECGEEQGHLCRGTDTDSSRHHGRSGQNKSSHHGHGHRGGNSRHC
ncbi:MAG: hypothetical protein Q4D16_18695 [Eubacteriales bacterium]|nr:hypothetical protein [Eubacteriales bacterium]